VAAMFVNGSGRNEQSLQRTFHRWFLPSFGSFCEAVSSSKKIAHFVPIHWQTWPPEAILVSDCSISKNILLWNRLSKWTETW
jgi:hypothetical protein